MTESDQSAERGEAERRELEAAGWEPKGRRAKTIWRSPSDGRWYAHYQAVKAVLGDEEARLLGEHGVERVPDDDTDDGHERWVRREEGPRLYKRSEALKKARGERS